MNYYDAESKKKGFSIGTVQAAACTANVFDLSSASTLRARALDGLKDTAKTRGSAPQRKICRGVFLHLPNQSK